MSAERWEREMNATDHYEAAGEIAHLNTLLAARDAEIKSLRERLNDKPKDRQNNASLRHVRKQRDRALEIIRSIDDLCAKETRDRMAIEAWVNVAAIKRVIGEVGRND